MTSRTTNFISILACIIALTSCASLDTGATKDKKIDFNQYKTYAWLHRIKTNKHADARIANEIVEERIIKNSNFEMEKRGYKIDTLNPDLLLDYDIVTEQKASDVPVSVYLGDYYFSYSAVVPQAPINTWVTGDDQDNGTVKDKYTFGTVVVYVGDRVKKQLVWEGWAQGSIQDVEAFEKELPKDIKSMFKHFPSKK